eukprot:COSAG06_NODE_2156_length_7453_cov_4.416372_3_plen_32_part_00
MGAILQHFTYSGEQHSAAQRSTYLEIVLESV